jgi:osmotically-inducible protein OsmY
MGTCFSDQALAEYISNLLQNDVHTSGQDIHISVNSGWVFLEGHVGYESDRTLVQSCVENVFGVSRVINNLTFPRVFHAN